MKTINDQSIWSYIRQRRSADPSFLDRTAVIDCTREYSYAQMFEEWERYARVFSALGMTEANASRVGIAGTISAEPLFAFYGLNMTGASVSMLSYPDFLPGGQWKTMIEKEKLTDLLLSDIMITPDLWPEIEKLKKELGLRNVIFLHSRLGGPCTGPAELVYDEFNQYMLKRLRGTVFMEDLLVQYACAPVQYGSGDPDHLAVITHTSGTTKGTRKPLPFTDRAVNSVATNFGPGFRGLIKGDAPEQLRLAPSFDFSSFLCMCGVVNSSLAVGDTVVLTFFGFMHPKFVRAVGYYGINVMFTSSFMIDSWMNRPNTDDIDFSSVKERGVYFKARNSCAATASKGISTGATACPRRAARSFWCPTAAWTTSWASRTGRRISSSRMRMTGSSILRTTGSERASCISRQTLCA